jgi:serine/threonine protein kinase
MSQVIADKYQIIQLLGEGGYGKVYLAEHLDLKIRYAVKVINSSSERFLDRFKQEAAVLQSFSHPGSVQLRDFGRTPEGYYMAMDYCEGRLLKEMVEQSGSFSIKEALSILKQVLTTLDAAHEIGIIHRDIKSENIMIITDALGERHPKILDFGVAKIKEKVGANPSVTQEGTTIGTPHYMSPEQAAGETDLDHRVDIYAAGVLGYELLTGELPFRGDTVVQTLLMQITKSPPPLSQTYGLPYPVEKVIEKALEKNRENRYATASEFAAAIDEVLGRFESATAARRAVPQGAHTVEMPAIKKEETHVLCLDDNEMILNIMQHILESAGYKVHTATDCSQIHNFLFGQNVRLLISDVQMPGLPGNKICKMLKQRMKDLKIVLFSNIPERELAKASEESLADGWISKNSKPNDWLTKIREVLG